MIESLPDLARTLVVVLSGAALGVLIVGYTVSVQAYREDPRPAHAELLGTTLSVLGVASLIVLNASRSLERFGLSATWHLYASVAALAFLLAGLVWLTRVNWQARVERAAKRSVGQQ